MTARKSRDGSYSQVCGEFNSKNSYGGYVGYVPFFAFVTDENVVAMKMVGDEDSTATVVRERCRKGP